MQNYCKPFLILGLLNVGNVVAMQKKTRNLAISSYNLRNSYKASPKREVPSLEDMCINTIAAGFGNGIEQRRNAVKLINTARSISASSAIEKLTDTFIGNPVPLQLPVRCAKFLVAHSNTLYVENSCPTLSIYDVQTGKKVGTLPGSRCILKDTKNKLLISAERSKKEKEIMLYNLENNKLVQKLSCNDYINRLIVQENNLYGAKHDENFHSKSSVRMWDLESGKKIKVLPKTNSLQDIKVHKNALFVACMGQIKIWDIRTKNWVKKLKINNMDNEYQLSMSKDGTRLYYPSGHPSYNTNITVYNTETESINSIENHHAYNEPLLENHDGTKLYIPLMDYIQVIETESYRSIQKIPSRSAQCMTENDNGTELYSCNKLSNVQIDFRFG